MFLVHEGEWDEVMAVVKAAVFKVDETSSRVGLALKADIRAGRDAGEISAKLERLQPHLDRGASRAASSGLDRLVLVKGVDVGEEAVRFVGEGR